MPTNKIKENNLYKFLKLYNKNEYSNTNINQLDEIIETLNKKNVIDMVLFNKKNLTVISGNDIKKFWNLFKDLKNVFTYDIGDKFLNLLLKEKIIEYKKIDKIEYKGFVLHFFKLYLKKDKKNEKI